MARVVEIHSCIRQTPIIMRSQYVTIADGLAT